MQHVNQGRIVFLYLHGALTRHEQLRLLHKLVLLCYLRGWLHARTPAHIFCRWLVTEAIETASVCEFAGRPLLITVLQLGVNFVHKAAVATYRRILRLPLLVVERKICCSSVRLALRDVLRDLGRYQFMVAMLPWCLQLVVLFLLLLHLNHLHEVILLWLLDDFDHIFSLWFWISFLWPIFAWICQHHLYSFCVFGMFIGLDLWIIFYHVDKIDSRSWLVRLNVRYIDKLYMMFLPSFTHLLPRLLAHYTIRIMFLKMWPWAALLAHLLPGIGRSYIWREGVVRWALRRSPFIHLIQWWAEMIWQTRSCRLAHLLWLI